MALTWNHEGAVAVKPPTWTVSGPVCGYWRPQFDRDIGPTDDDGAAPPKKFDRAVALRRAKAGTGSGDRNQKPWLPKGPVSGETDVMEGGCSTVKSTLLLLMPPTTTVTVPVLALLGTCASRLCCSIGWV